MKELVIALFIVSVGFLIAQQYVQKKSAEAYEEGLHHGSEYTLEYGYLPSMWHRERMHEYRKEGYDWSNIHYHSLKDFWDSVLTEQQKKWDSITAKSPAP